MYHSYLHFGVFVDKFVEPFRRRFVFPGQIVVVPLGRHQHMFLRFVLLAAGLDQFLCTKIKHDNIISKTRAIQHRVLYLLKTLTFIFADWQFKKCVYCPNSNSKKRMHTCI